MTLQLLDMRLKKLSTYPQKERRKEKRTKKEKKKEKLRLLTVNFFQDDTILFRISILGFRILNQSNFISSKKYLTQNQSCFSDKTFNAGLFSQSSCHVICI